MALGNKIEWNIVVKSILVWAICLLWFSPILWMFSTSLKPSLEATAERIPQWFPTNPTLDNYKYLFGEASGISVTKGFINSLIVALLSIFWGFVTSIPAAYALSRLKFKGRKLVFVAYVAILAFPGVLFLIPNFYIVHTLGLMDSFAALIVPGLGATFGVFMLRQYMMGISGSLEDAAWIDGCSKLRFLWSVVIPFIRPALLVLGLMTFIGSWNNFLWALLVLNDPSKMTLPVALVRFTAGWGDPFRGIGVLMAGSFVSVLPILVLFIAFHKNLMQGVSLGSVDK